MSKIGKQPVLIPEGVEVKLEDETLVVKSVKGELKQTIDSRVSVEIKDQKILTSSKDRAIWGLYRSLINNMVVGVSLGFKKELEIIGVGFKAEVKADKLIMSLGFSHLVEMEIPRGIALEIKNNVITVSGIDKQAVGEFSAKIRAKKKPEPYKGKGIRYKDEIVRRKSGKRVAGTG